MTVKLCISCLQAFDGDECGACAAERRYAERQSLTLLMDEILAEPRVRTTRSDAPLRRSTTVDPFGAASGRRR